MIRRILLVNAPFLDDRRQKVFAKYSMPPEGLLYLSAILRMHGYEVTVADLVLEPLSPPQIRRLLIQEHPDLVGIGAITSSFPAALRIFQMARQEIPGVVTVLGGAHAYAPAAELLNEPALDFVVRDDGEAALIELIETLNHREALALASLTGLLYRGKDGIQEQPPRPLISKLQALPLPDRAVVPFDRYGEKFVVSASRGCPGRCIFCVGSIQPHRMRDIQAVLAEVYWLYVEEGMQRLYFGDNVLTRIPEICEFIRRACPGLEWACECRIDSVDEKLLLKMHESGCIMVQFGIESGNQSVLDQVNKGIFLGNVRQAVAMARKAGLLVACTFMLGHYCDNQQTMQETLALIQELQRDYQVIPQLSFNTLFPGTYQAKHAQELGLEVETEAYHLADPNLPNLRGTNFSAEDLRQLFFEVSDQVDQTLPV